MRGRAPSPFPEAARTTAAAGSPAEPTQEDLPSPADADADVEAMALDGDEDRNQEEDGDGDDDDERDVIPPLASMAPAIFVRAVGDYTEPLPWEPDASKRLQSVVGELDAHTAAVRANIQAMVVREATRLQGECARSEAALRASMGTTAWPALSSPTSRSTSTSLSWSPPMSPFSAPASPPPPPSSSSRVRLPPPPDAERALLYNMEAEAPDPGTAPVLPFNFSHHDVAERVPDPRDTPRDRALTQLLNLVRRGMTEVDGYAAHAQTIRRATMQAYAVEVARQLQAQAQAQAAAAAPGHATTTPMDLS